MLALKLCPQEAEVQAVLVMAEVTLLVPMPQQTLAQAEEVAGSSLIVVEMAVQAS